MAISNPQWALNFLEEEDIAAVRERFAKERKNVTSSHSQHRMKHLKNSLEAAKEDAAAIRKHRQVLVDEYSKAHYRVEDDQRIVRVKRKEAPSCTRGDDMKGLVEYTFSTALKADQVEGQMRSSLRERHLTGEATQSGAELPRRKLTLLSNPLMAPDIPYNRRQERNSANLWKTLPHSAPVEARKISTPDLEGTKFTSLSRFLTGKQSKYLSDTRFTSALTRLRKRVRHLDRA